MGVGWCRTHCECVDVDVGCSTWVLDDVVNIASVAHIVWVSHILCESRMVPDTL